MPTPTNQRNLHQNRLKELLHYDPDTGLFTWLMNRSQMKCGDEAGTIRQNDGKRYLIISIDGQKYRAHRLAWLYTMGQFPDQLIDHINGNGLDNRWCNLREVDTVNNNRNMRLRSDNSSGIVGVHWSSKDRRWVVQIKTEHQRGYVGQFETLLDAVAARIRAQKEHDFHENHGQVRPL